jgi:malate/lactate dehydrogenase
MRRKVICTAATATGRHAALLLAQLDLADLLLVDAPEGLAGDLLAAAAPLGYDPRVSAGTWEDAAGAEVVVLDAVTAATAGEIAVRCSDAVVVVGTPDAPADVQRLLDASRLPRARILGAAGDGAGPVSTAAHALRLADAVLRDRGTDLPCAVQCRGEGGADGVAVRTVRIGAGGAREIL